MIPPSAHHALVLLAIIAGKLVLGCQYVQYFCNETFHEIDPNEDESTTSSLPSLCFEAVGNYYIQDFVEATGSGGTNFLTDPTADSCLEADNSVAVPVMTKAHSLGRLRLQPITGSDDEFDLDGILKCGNGLPVTIKKNYYAPPLLEVNAACTKYPIDVNIVDPFHDEWDAIEVMTYTPVSSTGSPVTFKFPTTLPASIMTETIPNTNGIWYSSRRLKPNTATTVGQNSTQVNIDIKSTMQLLEICPGLNNNQNISVSIQAKAKTKVSTSDNMRRTMGLNFTIPVFAKCIPTATKCCVNTDCTNPYGGKCNRATGTCACDTTKCEREVSFTGGDKVCQASCDCPNDCNSVTGTCMLQPLLNCQLCAFDMDSCQDGHTCDGKFCVPSGQCTSRKQHLCDNAYFSITGSPDQRSKCCPDSSGCVRTTLKLGENSVCSTTCGTSCMGTINGQTEYPKVQCSFTDTPFSLFAELELCYEDVVLPYCQLMSSVGADNFDVGSDLCKSASGVVGGEAGCHPPLPDPDYAVCCVTPHITQKTCNAQFVVPNTLPAGY